MVYSRYTKLRILQLYLCISLALSHNEIITSQLSLTLTLLRVSDLAYPVTLLREGRGLEFYKGHSPLVPDRHR